MTNGNGFGFCTGTVLSNSENKSFVITAKHCIEASKELYVENLKVIKTYSSISDDIAVLELNNNIPNKTPAILGKNNLKKNDEVFGVGYPNLDLYPLYGKIFLTAKDDSYIMMKSIHGCSGSGLFNNNDKLIGVLWGGVAVGNVNITLYSPLNEILNFIKDIPYEL